MCGYDDFYKVFIPFAFELTKNYEEFFPEKMINEVKEKLEEYRIDRNENFHIFFCYQYIAEIIFDTNVKLLFRPHFFIAKGEIDDNYNKLLGEGKGVDVQENYKGKTTYNEIQKDNLNRINNTCIFYDNEYCIINEDINNFSLHDGCLSFTIPTVDVIPENTNKINKTYIYYSFVLEHDKNIAALTIHFLCFPKGNNYYNVLTAMSNGDNFYKGNKTIESAIKFATENGDEEVVKFLNYITEKE